MTNHRDATTGEYVTAEHAQANPDTTVSEARTRRPASDHTELRKLAEACPPEDCDQNEWYSFENLMGSPLINGRDAQFVAACTPTVILELLDELDHLRTEDIPVIQQRRGELIARVAELEGLVEAEYAGRMRLAAIVREVRTHCAEVAEESEAAAYMLSLLDGDPGPDWVYCGRGPCVLRDGHEGGCEL